MPHQVDAVNKMLPTRIGGLFMDMGTGKSRTAIELAYRRLQKIDKVVWFCPVSLKETVKREILKHTNCIESDICVFNGKTDQKNIPSCLWYIIGIESMSSSPRVILTAKDLITENTFVILDESSYIKGHRANRTAYITLISEKARYRLIMTGTPLSQGVIDLYAQMRFLSPKILGYNSFYSFAANHLEYSEKYPGLVVQSHNIEYIAAKIKPYIYQVMKDECLDLPEKLYTTRYFKMTEEQWEWYNRVKYEVLSDIETMDDPRMNSIAIFRLFSALQQITCGFYNERLDKIMRGKKQKDKQFKLHTFDHDRTSMLLGAVSEIPEKEKIIIFCKFQQDIENIKKAIVGQYGQESISLFYGLLSEKERDIEIEKFRKSARFFLATQQSGGHGLTLNEAHHVIFYNNAFKYSERLQAEDRCHRIGQEHKVTYIDIHCCESIDDRIDQALYNKGNAVQQFKNEVEKVKKENIKELIKAL